MSTFILSRRRERRKGRQMLRVGLVREYQRRVGHHAVSRVTDVVDQRRVEDVWPETAARATAPETIYPPITWPVATLADFFGDRA